MVNIETSVVIFVGLTSVKDEHDQTDSMLTHSLRGVEEGKDDSANDVLQEGQTDMRRSLSSDALRRDNQCRALSVSIARHRETPSTPPTTL
jgi:hypothetical protein